MLRSSRAPQPSRRESTDPCVRRCFSRSPACRRTWRLIPLRTPSMGTNGYLLLRTSDAVLNPTPPPPVALKISGMCSRVHRLAEVLGVPRRGLTSPRCPFDRGDPRTRRTYPDSAVYVGSGHRSLHDGLTDRALGSLAVDRAAALISREFARRVYRCSADHDKPRLDRGEHALAPATAQCRG